MNPTTIKDQIRAIREVAAKYRLSSQQLERYIKPNELLVGYGQGGSEAIVILLQDKQLSKLMVRKIWNADFLAVGWDECGQGVMAPPLQKALLQIDYLNKLPSAAQPYFPRIHNSRITHATGLVQEVICDQDYIDGIEVSQFIAKYQPLPAVVAHLYSEIFRCLRKRIHPSRAQLREIETLEASYFSKIENRLAITKTTVPRTFDALMREEFIWIDGKRYLNISGLLDRFRKIDVAILEPRLHVFISGDTNTENIKIRNLKVLLHAMSSNDPSGFTYDDLGLMFLDPRAIGFESAGGDSVDDYMYDNKPLHNSLGNYDVIHGEHFDLSFSASFKDMRVDIRHHAGHPFLASYDGLDRHFKYIMQQGWGLSSSDLMLDDPHWLLRFAFVMGTHFAAMPPFHISRELDGVVLDDPQRQKRAVAIYCEGVKWLNIAYDMMTGERSELLGIPVYPSRSRA